MRRTRYVLLAAIAPLFTACGAIMHGSRQEIAVQSSVPGTTVQSVPVSTTVTTPGVLNLERKHNYVLTFSAPGYTPANVSIENGIGVGTVIADVVLGLVGVVVDGLTGSWYGLKPETASVTLLKQAGTIGPDAIHIQLGRVTGDGNISPRADAPGVSVEVTSK
jgi:hypothetical protein